MCSHQINKNITSKQSSDSSHLLVFLLDSPDARNAVTEHLKSKCFLAEDHHEDPHIFLTNHTMEQEVKLGRAKLPKRD